MAKKETKSSTKKIASEESEKILKLEEQVAALEAEVLYSKAEAQNVRKRSLEDIDKARKFAVENLAKKFCWLRQLDAA